HHAAPEGPRARRLRRQPPVQGRCARHVCGADPEGAAEARGSPEDARGEGARAVLGALRPGRARVPRVPTRTAPSARDSVRVSIELRPMTPEFLEAVLDGD